MRPPASRFAQWARIVAGLAGWLAAVSVALAQSATGTVQGRVYNPARNQFVRNAEVRLEGTSQVVFTENDGSFQFANVPAGSATVTVTFSGYNTAKDTFTVTAGQTAVRDINLTSTAQSGDVVQLQAFTVASEREGNSKAIMAQRRDMNIITSVSSDIFGDVTDGNVGEFLKYLPGVDLDYVESEPRGPRLGGMEGQYVGVSFDGMRSASADANRGGGSASRATSFEGFSITSIDSIEVNRTSSPENDADSPAGTVNMKTKRAFDRKGRVFGYNVSYNFNSEEMTLKATDGPRDKKDKKAKPNFQFDYAESFFNQRFGVLMSMSRAHSYTEQIVSTAGYNTTAVPAVGDTRPMVIRQLDFKDGPKYIRKDAMLLTADWKVTQNLTLSLNTVYSYYDGEFWNRNFTFVAANDNANATVANGRASVDGDGINTVIANRVASGSTVSSKNNTVATLNLGGGGASKLAYTRQIAPRFEFKQGAWVVDGALAFSKAKNNYEAIERGFSSGETGGIASSFIATRPNDRSWEWTIRQTSGPSWQDFRNFTSTDTRAGGTRVNNDDRTWTTEKWTGTLNARWALPFMERFRTTVKAGAKWDEEARDNNNHNDWAFWTYFGPGGNSVVYNPASQTWSTDATSRTYTLNGQTWTNTGWGNWANVGANYVSANPFETGRSNALTVIGGMPPRPSRNAPAELFQQHPELFVNVATLDNYYNSWIANKRDFTQTLTSAYMQADTRITSKLQVRFGVRAEETENALKEFDPLTRAQMLQSPYASQFASANQARATSIDGLVYQFTKNPRVTRSSTYRNYFPSVVFKYNILPNFEWQAGWNKGISRPPIDNLTGLWTVDEQNQRVSAPNPDLLPERHKVYQTRMIYYFGGKSPGQLSLAFIQDEATNFITSKDYTPAEFGIDDPDFQNYTFRSTQNSAELQRYRNMDFNYNQTLGFLPSEYLRGLNFGFTYSRSYANQRRNFLAPHRVTARMGYTYRRFNGSFGLIWADDRPGGSGTSNYGQYFGALTKLDLSLTFKLTRYTSLYVQGRNITNAPDLWYQSPPGVQETKNGYLRQMEEYGANWVFGLKGQF